MENGDRAVETSGEGERSDRTGEGALRYGAALPIAAIVTIGLTVSMAALIATEFTPQDKADIASFEINPRVDEPPSIERTKEPELLKKVEIPPAPPTLDITKTVAVDLPIVEVPGKTSIFDTDRLEIEMSSPVEIDQDPTPLVRIPPVFPNRFLQGDVSGYCGVQFDISAEGLPFNVQTTVCTNNQLKSATVKSVQKWKYAPQMRNGNAVSRSGLKTTIRFDLKDEGGETLPVPEGY